MQNVSVPQTFQFTPGTPNEYHPWSRVYASWWTKTKTLYGDKITLLLYIQCGAAVRPVFFMPTHILRNAFDNKGSSMSTSQANPGIYLVSFTNWDVVEWKLWSLDSHITAFVPRGPINKPAIVKKMPTTGDTPISEPMTPSFSAACMCPLASTLPNDIFIYHIPKNSVILSHICTAYPNVRICMHVVASR